MPLALAYQRYVKLEFEEGGDKMSVPMVKCEQVNENKKMERSVFCEINIEGEMLRRCGWGVYSKWRIADCNTEHGKKNNDK